MSLKHYLTIIFIFSFFNNSFCQSFYDSIPFIKEPKKVLKNFKTIPANNINIVESQDNEWSNKIGNVVFSVTDGKEFYYIYNVVYDTLLVNNKKTPIRLLMIAYMEGLYYCFEKDADLNQKELAIINSWSNSNADIRKANIAKATFLVDNQDQSNLSNDTLIIFRVPSKEGRLFKTLPSKSPKIEEANEGKKYSSRKETTIPRFKINSPSLMYLYDVAYDTLTNGSNKTLQRLVLVNYNDSNYYCYVNELDLTYKESSIIFGWTKNQSEFRKKKVSVTKEEIKNKKKFEDKIEQVRLNEERITDSIATANYKKQKNLKHLEIKKKIDVARSNGLILMWDWYEDKVLSSYTQGFSFNIINPGKKRIKYIYITVSIYNTVDDFISKKILTVVGAIEPNNSGEVKFENVFYSKVVGSAKVNSIKILYFDGSTRTYSESMLKNITIHKTDYYNFINNTDY